MADYNNDETKRTEKMAKKIAVAQQRMAEQKPQYDPQMRYTENEPIRNWVYNDNKMVKSPPHYADAEIECIDAMRASMSTEAFSGYCKGNVMKYLWRYEKKGEGTQDLEKAKVYLGWLIDNETDLYEKPD
tara:strand:+ start:863 stop:1252 length:390 start_codon:yes stop_codon:yes gene_type:complete